MSKKSDRKHLRRRLAKQEEDTRNSQEARGLQEPRGLAAWFPTVYESYGFTASSAQTAPAQPRLVNQRAQSSAELMAAFTRLLNDFSRRPF